MLQLQLLTNGFRLLKVGGSLVYSTCRCALLEFGRSYLSTIFGCISLINSCFCFVLLWNSLTFSQNEDVVDQFLLQNASAGKILVLASVKI